MSKPPEAPQVSKEEIAKREEDLQKRKASLAMSGTTSKFEPPLKEGEEYSEDQKKIMKYLEDNKGHVIWLDVPKDLLDLMRQHVIFSEKQITEYEAWLKDWAAFSSFESKELKEIAALKLSWADYEASLADLATVEDLIRDTDFCGAVMTFDFNWKEVEKKRDMILCAFHCCVNGPVGVGKETEFPKIEGSTTIRKACKPAAITSRIWKKFCLLVAGKLGDLGKDGNMMLRYKRYWPLCEDDFDKDRLAALEKREKEKKLMKKD